MYVKSFGIVILKGSVILANRTPFYAYNITLKKIKSGKNNNDFYLIF